jgi:putative transposase
MKKIPLKLKKEECVLLKEFVAKGTKKARAIARANVLLLLDEGWDMQEVANAVGVHRQRVWRIKRRFLDEGLQAALQEKPRSGQPSKYTRRHEARIIAEACTDPPKGRRRWTVRLLTSHLRKERGFETINRESVRMVLKKAKLNPG